MNKTTNRYTEKVRGHVVGMVLNRADFDEAGILINAHCS